MTKRGSREPKQDDGVPSDEEILARMKAFGLALLVMTVLNARCFVRMVSLFTAQGPDAGPVGFGIAMGIIWSYLFGQLGVTRLLKPEWPILVVTRRGPNRGSAQGHVPRPAALGILAIALIPTALYSFVDLTG